MALFQSYQAGGGQLQGLFQSLTEYGFQDFLLPTLLIFTVIFATLQNIKLFKSQKMTWDATNKKWVPAPAVNNEIPMVGDKKINSILALLISLAITIPHIVGLYPQDMDPISLMSSFLPSTGVALVAMLLVLMVLGFVGVGITKASALQMVIALVMVGILIFVFLTNMFPYWFPTLNFLRDPVNQAIIFTLLTGGLIVYFVMREGGGEEMPQRLERWMLKSPFPAAPAARGGAAGGGGG